MAQLIRCPHCNKFIDKNSKICPKCSQPLIDKIPTQEQPMVQKVTSKSESMQKIEESDVVGAIIESKEPVYKSYKLESQTEEEQLEDIKVDETEEAIYSKPELKPDQADIEGAREEQISTDKEMEAFYASMNQDKVEKNVDDESMGKKISGFAENVASNIVNNSKAIIGKGKESKEVELENNSSSTDFVREHTSITNNDSRKETYNANADGYYDYVTAEIDARTEHVTTEMVIKTISFIAIVIVIVVGMINFI